MIFMYFRRKCICFTKIVIFLMAIHCCRAKIGLVEDEIPNQE